MGQITNVTDELHWGHKWNRTLKISGRDLNPRLLGLQFNSLCHYHAPSESPANSNYNTVPPSPQDLHAGHDPDKRQD